ncbi:hypothetical protein [Chitinimonas lacunae]|uniref:Uncharacterized protein n=1 Tax=Chitinimonas lacunae TaxID=1963018 RepID=A0ABV8MPS8_9NEIS
MQSPRNGKAGRQLRLDPPISRPVPRPAGHHNGPDRHGPGQRPWHRPAAADPVAMPT